MSLKGAGGIMHDKTSAFGWLGKYQILEPGPLPRCCRTTRRVYRRMDSTISCARFESRSQTWRHIRPIKNADGRV
jgi:hypothetical protein